MANICIGCEAEGFEENWIEYRPAWTRGDTKRLDAADQNETLKIIAGKMAKCHIVGSDGSVIEAAEQLTVDALDELDEVLAQWLVASIYRMIGVKRQLGNLSASASSAINGRKTPTPTQTTETSQTA